VVTDHPLGEGTDILVLPLSNMRDLWVCGLAARATLAPANPNANATDAAIVHDFSFRVLE
jgi:hypothetical protein